MNALDKLIEAGYESALSYSEYCQLIDKLHNEEKTTGAVQSDVLLEYSKLNKHRMDRIGRNVKIYDETQDILDSIDEPLTWILITEAWCGDAAQSLPVINAMAEASDKINLKLVLRDDHPELMDMFLTNGGKSIPKLICVSNEDELLFTWGPRPEVLQQKVKNYKAQSEPKPEYSEFVKDLQKWYAKDKAKSIQSEIADLIKNEVTIGAAN
ncbi:thioredoxin family protein [Halocola ammonii]